MKTFNTFAVAALTFATAQAQMTDVEETSLDLYKVSSRYHFNLQRLLNGSADGDDIADLTRSYTRELEITINGLPIFTTDSSLVMLSSDRQSELVDHVEAAVDDYVEWWGENQALFSNVRAQYDQDNFDIMHTSLSRTIQKALDVMSDTVNYLPHYADHPEVMELMVQHMIDQWDFAQQDLTTALHDVREETTEVQNLPTRLMDLADEIKQILAQLNNDLRRFLREKTYQAEVGGAANHPDAWTNLQIDTLRMTQNRVRGIRDSLIGKTNALGGSRSGQMEWFIENAHYSFADPGNMQDEFYDTFVAMNPEADRGDLYNRQVLGLLSNLNYLSRGFYMMLEATWDQMAQDKSVDTPAKKVLNRQIAPRNDTGKCSYSEWCIECYEFSFDNKPNEKMYNCQNKDKEFQFGWEQADCNGREPNLCGSGDQPCMFSWKYGARHACRNPAAPYMVTLPHPTASWDANNVDTTNNRGVCNVTNCEGRCVWSWINNGHDAYRSQNWRCLID